MAATIISLTKKSLQRLLGRLLSSFKSWWKHEHADTAASLTFYSLISLVPMLITGVTIAAWLVDEETAKSSLLEGTSSIAGTSVADYFSSLLGRDIQGFGSKFSPYIGALFLLFSATKVIAELRKCLGKIFIRHSSETKTHALDSLINRGVAVLLILCLGILIASIVIMDAIIGVIYNAVDDYIFIVWLTDIFSPVATFAAMTLLAAITMRWLPRNPPKFTEALRGGAISAIILLALKLGLAQMLSNANFSSFSGSAVTLVLVLFWIYFAMQAYLFGAEYAAELIRERQEKEQA